MPKYKITEIDNTGNTSYDILSNVVYIPGAATKVGDPTLCSTIAELDKVVNISKDDLSYKLAKHCIQLGMQVLYQGFVVDENSKSITISSDDWKKLRDKALYNIKFLTTGGYAIPTKDMVACAENRGDCIALVDVASSITQVSEMREAIYKESKGEDGKTTVDIDLRSKYASCFVPWFKASWTDSDLGEDDIIPGSFGYLFAYARSVQSNPSWYAVAGTFRGSIPELVSPKQTFTTAEIEILQGRSATAEVELDDKGDNVGFAINPIAYVNGYGYLIWGNRTLIDNKADANTSVGILTASSFLNIRNLCNDIKKTLYEAARKYTFEQNSNILWLNFKSEITPLLDKMVSGNGIDAYVVERVETNAKARLAARVSITPINAVEDFELEVYLEDSLEVVE